MICYPNFNGEIIIFKCFYSDENSEAMFSVIKFNGSEFIELSKKADNLICFDNS